MDEHVRALHASVTRFIVWLTHQPPQATLRHEYPQVVDRFRRWRHDRLARNATGDKDASVAMLKDRGAGRYEWELAGDALNYY